MPPRLSLSWRLQNCMRPRSVNSSMDDPNSRITSFKLIQELRIFHLGQPRLTLSRSSSQRPKLMAFQESQKQGRTATARIKIQLWIGLSCQMEVHTLHRQVAALNSRITLLVVISQPLSTCKVTCSTRSQRSSSRKQPHYSKKSLVNDPWATKWRETFPLWIIKIWIPEWDNKMEMATLKVELQHRVEVATKDQVKQAMCLSNQKREKWLRR